MRILAPLLVLTTALACGPDDPLSPAEGSMPDARAPTRSTMTLRERLVEPQRFSLVLGSGELRLCAPHRGFERIVPLTIEKAGASIRVTSEGALLASTLWMDIADIPVPPHGILAKGAVLDGVRARLEPRALDVSWSDHDTAHFEGDATLQIAWTLVTADARLPLKPIELERIPVSGVVFQDLGGALVLELESAAQGDVFRWGEILELSDLRLDVILASEAATVSL